MEEQKDLKELKVLQNEGIPVTPDAGEVKSKEEVKPPEPEKPLEIVIGIGITQQGFEVKSIGGHFPGNTVAIRGLLDEAKEVILSQLIQRKIKAEMLKNKIVKPVGMIQGLKEAGRKILH